jgi:hypothetical protein
MRPTDRRRTGARRDGDSERRGLLALFMQEPMHLHHVSIRFNFQPAFGSRCKIISNSPAWRIPSDVYSGFRHFVPVKNEGIS